VPPELPASALYATPSLGRLWKKVHRSCSPFVLRPSLWKLYVRPAPTLRKILSSKSYHWIALGCAEARKESLLLPRLPPPSSFHAADTNLNLARRALRHIRSPRKSCHSVDLTSAQLPPSITRIPKPWLISLFGVLPNLDPLPLLARLRRAMSSADLLLLSANLAPGQAGFAGARQVLPQYDNPPTRQWLETAVQRYRPRLPKGRLEFGVFPDPREKSLARIEARWTSNRPTRIVFSSRRPTAAQVEGWIFKAGLRKVAHFLDPHQEEGLWLVKPV